ncbi:hypothetical protein SAG0053_10430 [Streptococcus agalactiae CCUG 25532]|jgi:hypothetical protein|nr:hypothetical protein SAG0053_10430 [Streptococcus agalactiae CCUG 25532]
MNENVPATTASATVPITDINKLVKIILLRRRH